MTFTFN